MRILFATTAGAGHFGPLVPFVEGCRRAGHEVIVAAPSAFGPAIERAGFPVWPCADTSDEAWGAIVGRLQSLSPEEANRVVVGEVFARLDARTTLPRMREAMKDWKPDVVVRESAEFGSCVAAELAGIPQVRVAVGLASAEEWALPVAAEQLAVLREEVGLTGDPHGERLRSSPYLTIVPPLMEDPDIPGPVDAHRFRHPDSEPPALPDWWPGEPYPLVYVTFGTVAPGMPGIGDLYLGVLGALADLPVRVLATVGEAVDPASIPSPPNVHVERWFPQAGVLPHASAVVCHGGFGSVHGALTAGVPLVVVPFFADQPMNAARVAALGAGVAVAPPSPDEVRGALLKLLEDDAFTLAAERVADDYRRLPPADQAAGWLERYISGPA
jgi:UDP:flavonoid glycosyltransferase YjiC (YdhE family)